MAYAALDAIDDAIDVTKAFLLPFDLRKWLRLAVIMFFVAGGGGGVANQASNAPQFADSGGDVGGGAALPDVALGAVALAVIAFVVLLFLFFLFATPIMEFVFVESLFAREVHVRRYFSRNVGNGLRLLAFQIAVGLVGLVLIGVPFLLVLFGLLGGIDGGAAFAGLFLLVLPFFFLYLVVAGTINGFTRVFVVPIMLAEERGLLSAWGRLWAAITDDIAEFFVYLVVSVILGFGVGIIAGFASLFVLLLVGIPFGAVAFGVYTAAGTSLVAIAVFVILGLIALVLYLVAINLVQVPLQSFLRYYAMLVLGDIDADLDPIPDIRAEVRTAE